jgi:hypothetical protein
MPLAEWSGEAAIKHQQNVRLPEEAGQPNGLALGVLQREIRRGYVQGDFWHGGSPLQIFSE